MVVAFVRLVLPAPAIRAEVSDPSTLTDRSRAGCDTTDKIFQDDYVPGCHPATGRQAPQVAHGKRWLASALRGRAFVIERRPPQRTS